VSHRDGQFLNTVPLPIGMCVWGGGGVGRRTIMRIEMFCDKLTYLVHFSARTLT
jgi:hypothetical protein